MYGRMLDIICEDQDLSEVVSNIKDLAEYIESIESLCEELDRFHIKNSELRNEFIEFTKNIVEGWKE